MGDIILIYTVCIFIGLYVMSVWMSIEGDLNILKEDLIKEVSIHQAKSRAGGSGMVVDEQGNLCQSSTQDYHAQQAKKGEALLRSPTAMFIYVLLNSMVDNLWVIYTGTVLGFIIHIW